MPTRNKRKTSRTTRRTNITRTGRNPTAPLYNTMPWLGLTRHVVHRYNDSCTLDPAISTPASYVFKANDVYDPNFTSTGHQPLAYDQLAAMYNKYCVVSSEIRVTFCPKTTTDTVQNIGGIVLSSTSSLGGTSLYEILEQPLNRYIAFRNSATYGGPKSITHSCNVARFTGIRNVLTSPGFNTTIGSSPSDPIYYILWLSAEDETNTAAIDCQVELVYHVVWSRPKYVTGS